jgi:RNA-directed DNA polymerase
MRFYVIDGLAEAFLAGPWSVDKMVARGALAFGRRYRWLRPLANRVIAAFPQGPPQRKARLFQFLSDDRGLLRIRGRSKLLPRFVRWPAPVMGSPSGPESSWPVPAIATPGELARFLDLSPGELDWFADCQSRERAKIPEPLRHYRYNWVAKPSGSLRLIEAPKPRLKQLQRRLLDEILAHIPPHQAAHGFRAGHSIASFVAPHVGQTIVLKMDLRDFFVSITGARVFSLFLTAGYPEAVARLLTGLCTNVVPLDVWKQSAALGLEPASSPENWRARMRYRQPHIPQGAPTSPALANLAAYRLDARLAGLAQAAEALYTRYADDLVFSGGAAFARSIRRFPIHVAAIALEEGFAVNHRKTRVMRQGVRQHAAGIVINQKVNVARNDYDRLKAVLCNCVRHGPGSQNREGVADFRAHLAGRVAHVARLNPARGERLVRMFEAIDW